MNRAARFRLLLAVGLVHALALATGCINDPNQFYGFGGRYGGLLFPNEGRIHSNQYSPGWNGDTLMVLLDSNVIPFADGNEFHDASVENIEIVLRPNSSSAHQFNDIVLNLRSVFRVFVDDASVWGQGNEGTYVTVAMFDLPALAAFETGPGSDPAPPPAYPFYARIVVRKTDAADPEDPFGTSREDSIAKRLARVQILGTGGRAFGENLSPSFTRAIVEDLALPTTIKIRPKRSFFEPSWRIGAIQFELTIHDYGTCIADINRAYGRSEASNALVMIDGDELQNMRTVTLIHPSALELKAHVDNSSNVVDNTLMADGPLIDLHVEEVAGNACSTADFVSDLELADLVVTDVNGDFFKDGAQQPIGTVGSVVFDTAAAPDPAAHFRIYMINRDD